MDNTSLLAENAFLETDGLTIEPWNFLWQTCQLFC